MFVTSYWLSVDILSVRFVNCMQVCCVQYNIVLTYLLVIVAVACLLCVYPTPGGVVSQVCGAVKYAVDQLEEWVASCACLFLDNIVGVLVDIQ